MRLGKLLIAATLLAVAACQPAPEERFERVTFHIDESDGRSNTRGFVLVVRLSAAHRAVYEITEAGTS